MSEAQRRPDYEPVEASIGWEYIPILILNWNGWDDTFQCLRSIRSLEDHHTVWLVDNGSDQDRTSEAQSLFPGLRVLRWNDNFGWAGGYNRALKVAAAEGHSFAYLLNNDSTVTPGFLSSVVAAAQVDAQIAAVGSRVVSAMPTGFVTFDGQYHDAGAKPLLRSGEVNRVTEVNGAGMLVRLSAIQRNGYFDERFFCYFEEAEWCYRVTRRGWTLAVAEGSVIVHRGEGSNVSANTVYYRTRNVLLLHRTMDGSPWLFPGLCIAYRGMRAANLARQHGEWEKAYAISSGVWDGLRGRVGKRPTDRYTVIPHLIACVWPFPSGIFLFRVRAVRCKFRRFVANLKSS